MDNSKLEICETVDIHSEVSRHVETVVLLSQQKADDYIEVELELDELDLTSAESKVTYAEINFGILSQVCMCN